MEPNQLKQTVGELSRTYAEASNDNWLPFSILALAFGIVFVLVYKMGIITLKNVNDRQNQANERIDRHDEKHEDQRKHNERMLEILNELKMANEISKTDIQRNKDDIRDNKTEINDIKSKQS